MTYRHETLFILPVLLVACAGKTVDVGQDEEGATGIDERSDPAECEAIATERAQARAEALTPTLTETPAHSGVWTGYIEHHQFPSGSDKVSLVLAQDGSGTVAFGEGEGDLPPEVSNPELVVPMGIGTGSYPGFDTQEGYAYPLYRVEAAGDRLRFQTRTAEVFGQWCAMQTPHDAGMCDYRCIEQFSSGAWLESGCFMLDPSDPNIREEVSCALWAFCGLSTACECTAESCDFSADYGDSFDGTLTDGGAAMVGTFQSLSSNNVRLFRE